MSAIMFRRTRFMRIAIIALLLVPVLWLLVTWLGDGSMPTALKFTGVKNRIREAPVLVTGNIFLCMWLKKIFNDSFVCAAQSWVILNHAMWPYDTVLAKRVKPISCPKRNKTKQPNPKWSTA